MSGNAMIDPRAALPRWKCHKVVQAAKIYAVQDMGDGSLKLLFGDPDGEQMSPPIEVGASYVEKHKPAVGGYFVRYEDGYESWSPAEAFESGYTPAHLAGPNAGQVIIRLEKIEMMLANVLGHQRGTLASKASDGQA